MEYGTAAAQIAVEASVEPHWSKKACGSCNQDLAQPALQGCGNCSRTRHNAQTCKKDVEISSKLDASTPYIGSLFNSDEIEDA
jgi:hypothetical protein